MLNPFARTGSPDASTPIAESLQIGNLLDDPALRAVMVVTTAPVPAAAARKQRWRRRPDDFEHKGAA